ncbi:hypothetical protein K493DRAFT_301277 [Basidiobolus meristosporus CBS 931.73]|uniref:F-box domain-containing protein n=1 Tax=Basidiobolus meristosporus CBS 931.73 TaxID=1314790 RepID=A0A1Y1YCN1_9FUNG|nr:hypothetical protein K493DRAFT_301277 [Basidiobolus meristosporus CBS 931.73]|eukprot:ORX95747.1 hypothetical protein K493DRAFT_301277 [Basidiobolus meristosporus CBS 931.73]
MSVQLPLPCLRQIFGWLKSDKDTCHALTFVNHLWSEAAVMYLYRDPWTLLAHKNIPQSTRKLALTKLLRTYLSCLEYDSFDSEELDAVTTIDALCSHVGYLDRFYLLIQNFFNQMNPILDEVELQLAVEAFESMYYSAFNRPFYDYLCLARTFDLVALQDFLRLVKADPFPFLSFEYTPEEALVDQRLALKLWSVTRSRCAPCITSLTWNATVPLKEIFPEPLTFYSLTELKLIWKPNAIPSQIPENHLEYVASSCHNLEVLHLTTENRQIQILDRDIANVIRNQQPNSLREFKISGVSDPLHETLEALVEHHRGSFTSLSICNNDSGQIPFSKIADFPNLKALELVDCFLRDRDVESIAVKGSPLAKIALRKLHQITCRSIRKLVQKSGPALRKLVIEEIHEHVLDTETVEAIAQSCRNIQHFQIELIRIDNVDLANLLSCCHKLKYLSFGELSSYLPADGDHMVNVILENCPLLKQLYAPEMVTTESGLQALLQHRQLEKMSLPTILI